MTLKEKLKWNGQIESRRRNVHRAQEGFSSGTAQDSDYYFFVGTAAWYAVEVYLGGNTAAAKTAAEMVVRAALEYFYGDWRSILTTPDGRIGQEAWKPFCLWYEQVMESLPFAAALSDWKAMKRISDYPPENKLPEAAKARGETAWGWALICFLRGDHRSRVEEFLAKSEGVTAKRPKLLCPVLRALLDNDPAQFDKTLQAYLDYYRKREFKCIVGKILSLEGTILYHLGRKQGFNVELPEHVADHIIRFDQNTSRQAHQV